MGIALGVVLTGFGWLAQWWPALDLVNNALPALAAGSIVLFLLALVTRDWRSIALAGLLAAINVGLIFAGLHGAAAEAAPDAKRFLRVVTFNLRFDNDRIDGVDKFLNQTDADVVVLQEVTKDRLQLLRQGLGSRYPYSVGEFSIVIFSKYPIKADGRVDRPGYPEWIRLLARWVEIDVNGTAVEVVGVHCARPFYPVLQEHDAAALTQFVLTRKLPIIVAGDFNMTPWTGRSGGDAAATPDAIDVWQITDLLVLLANGVKYLEANGFAVTSHNTNASVLDRIKRQAGVGDTAKIDGYVIEGHVPAADIKRLVAERPDALGLTVPGMPAGSPGMEQGDETEPYDVLLIKKDGTAEIFTRH